MRKLKKSNLAGYQSVKIEMPFRYLKKLICDSQELAELAELNINRDNQSRGWLDPMNDAGRLYFEIERTDGTRQQVHALAGEGADMRIADLQKDVRAIRFRDLKFEYQFTIWHKSED